MDRSDNSNAENFSSSSLQQRENFNSEPASRRLEFLIRGSGCGLEDCCQTGNDGQINNWHSQHLKPHIDEAQAS